MLAPITACITGLWSGLVIADVSPEAIAIVKNTAFTPLRFGKPKLTFDAPQVVLTFSSSWSLLTKLITCFPAELTAPIGITNGSTTISEYGIP